MSDIILKPLPLGEQDFRGIIESNKLYVDKTPEIFKLLDSKGKYFFLSRPRRFGKSLLVSTLEEIFSGNQELFKGLYIYDKIEWKKYPVIHIDFTAMLYTEGVIGFKSSFLNNIKSIGEEYNIKPVSDNYKEAFKELIKLLSEQEKVVILIDEYDKPITNFVEKPDIYNEMREILKNFYETIKESDQYIKFALLTGVSKFSKVSVFSGLNNLIDITLDEKYSTLLGYTDKELDFYFREYFHELEKKFSISEFELRKEIKNWYNGYSWDGKNFVYNPYSILSLIYHNDFGNYWFTSGTPTFLIKLIKEYKIDITSFENIEFGANSFDSFEPENINVESLLFQTGYLTIKQIIQKSITRKQFVLNYPNQEVKESFMQYLLKDFTGKNRTEILIDNISDNLRDNNLETFFANLKSLFADIPAEIFLPNKEAYYHTIIYLILKLVGVRINVEVHTNKGRIDAVIETEQKVFIFEFKMSSVNQAIKQIESKKYYEKYLNSGKEIILIGVSFDMQERNIKDYIINTLEN